MHRSPSPFVPYHTRVCNTRCLLATCGPQCALRPPPSTTTTAAAAAASTTYSLLNAPHCSMSTMYTLHETRREGSVPAALRMPLRLWRTATVCSSNDLSFSFVLSWRIGRSPEIWTRPFATMACGRGVWMGVDGGSVRANSCGWERDWERGRCVPRVREHRTNTTNTTNTTAYVRTCYPHPAHPCLAVMTACWRCKFGDDRFRLRGLELADQQQSGGRPDQRRTSGDQGHSERGVVCHGSQCSY